MVLKGSLLSAMFEKNTMLVLSSASWITKLLKPQVLPEWKRRGGVLRSINQPAA